MYQSKHTGNRRCDQASDEACSGESKNTRHGGEASRLVVVIQRVRTSYAFDVISDDVLEGIVYGKVDDADYRDTCQGWKGAYVMVSRSFSYRLRYRLTSDISPRPFSDPEIADTLPYVLEIVSFKLISILIPSLRSYRILTSASES